MKNQAESSDRARARTRARHAQFLRMIDVMSISTLVGCVIAASGGACVWHDDGSHVEVTLVHRATVTASPAAAGEPRTFVTRDGDVVSITRALVSVESVALIACDGAAAWLYLRELFGPTVAHAQHLHGESDSGAPTLDDLARADLEPLALARLAPRLGAYCAVRARLAPATAETHGVAAEPTMLGRTLYVEARVQRGGVGEAVPITLASSGVRTVDIALRDAGGMPLPIELTGVEAPSVVLAMVYDTWLDAIPLSPEGASAAGDAALERVAASFVHDAPATPIHHH